MSEITRRGFLGSLGFAVAAVAISPLEAIAAETDPKITVYAVRPHRIKTAKEGKDMPISSPFTDQVYELAIKFFKEQVGIDLDMKYFDSEEKIPKNLDRRNEIALIEKKNNPELGYAAAKELFDHIKGKETKKNIDYLIRTTRLESEDVYGMCFSEENKIYLKYFGDEIKNCFDLFDNAEDIENQMKTVTKKERKRLMKKRDKIRNEVFKIHFPKIFYKSRARMIVHEIAHRLGLWHSFQYSNDGIEDKIGKIPNLLSYNDLDVKSSDEYGFGVTDFQKKWMRDFALGKEPYQLMVQAGWNFEKYCKLVEKKFGFKK